MSTSPKNRKIPLLPPPPPSKSTQSTSSSSSAAAASAASIKEEEVRKSVVTSSREEEAKAMAEEVRMAEEEEAEKRKKEAEEAKKKEDEKKKAAADKIKKLTEEIMENPYDTGIKLNDIKLDGFYLENGKLDKEGSKIKKIIELVKTYRAYRDKIKDIKDTESLDNLDKAELDNLDEAELDNLDEAELEKPDDVFIKKLTDGIDEAYENKKISFMVNGNLDIDKDKEIINVIKTNVDQTNKYTPENAKDVAKSDKFINLLAAAMKDAKGDEAHNILWDKITPEGFERSRIKRLAIQDIINNDDFTLDINNIMTANSKLLTKQEKIPIILGIKNGDEVQSKVQSKVQSRLTTFGNFFRAEKNKNAEKIKNLCGYLLDYVFVKERKSEEFTLLAMYVAVNIDKNCFKEYILDKEDTHNNDKCNKAFKNIASLLKSNTIFKGVNEDTCINSFTISIGDTYVDDWQNEFDDVIKTAGASDNINDKLAELTRQLKAVQKKFDEITYHYYKKKNDLPDNVYNNVDILQKYINVIQILKKRNDYEVNDDFMSNAINDYIEDADYVALEYIKNRNEENIYIKNLKEEDNLKK
jgi:hypothetical protein